jgi:GWxTD domain-containing protein
MTIHSKSHSDRDFGRSLSLWLLILCCLFNIGIAAAGHGDVNQRRLDYILGEAHRLQSGNSQDGRSKALALLKENSWEFREVPEFLIEYGDACYNSGYFREAYKQFKRALKLKPDELQYRVAAVKVLLKGQITFDQFNEKSGYETLERLDELLPARTITSYKEGAADRWQDPLFKRACLLKARIKYLRSLYHDPKKVIELLDDAGRYTELVLAPLVDEYTLYPEFLVTPDNIIAELCMINAACFEKKAHGLRTYYARQERQHARNWFMAARYHMDESTGNGFFIIPGTERHKEYRRAINDHSRRAFITMINRSVDPTRHTAVNELWQELLAKKVVAHLICGDGERNRWGWETPMGSAFIVFGVPAQTWRKSFTFELSSAEAYDPYRTRNTIPVSLGKATWTYPNGVVLSWRQGVGDDWEPASTTKTYIDNVLDDRVAMIQELRSEHTYPVAVSSSYTLGGLGARLEIWPTRPDRDWWQLLVTVIVNNSAGMEARTWTHRVQESEIYGLDSGRPRILLKPNFGSYAKYDKSLPEDTYTLDIRVTVDPKKEAGEN